MLWWARILCSALLSASVLVIVTLIYFYFTFSPVSSKIKFTPSRKLSVHKISYDFKRLLTRFYSLEKEKEAKEFTKIAPQVTPPKLEAIYCGKRKKVALLKFQNKSFWVEEKEVIKGWKVEKITPFSVILKFNQIKITQELFEEKEKEGKTQKNSKKTDYFNQKVF